jgi:carbon-monoxide dehydrogenase large subunit
MTGFRYIGQPLERKEDRRLLAGRGKFIADVQLPRMAHVAFARSPVAHGRIRSIEVSAAQRLAGVIAVYTARELSLAPVPGLQNKPPASWRARVEHAIDAPDQPLIAAETVRYAGEAYAVVVAETRYIAEDAIELIEAEFEQLPVIRDIEQALAPNSEKVHSSLGSNIIAKFALRRGDMNASGLRAVRRIRRRFVNHRYLATPMECRGVVAGYDDRHDSITVWSATQVVHWVRREVAKQLNLPEGRVRCIAPDVGGGFGVKGHVYPEDVVIPYLARQLGRPVCWIEDRQEHLINATHSRDDVHDVEAVFDDQGYVLALKDEFIKDSGAYMPVGLGAPSNSATHICGPYHIPNLELTATVVVTNKTPNAPYRGSGRPEAAFVMERLMDLIARELDLDPVDVRFRNMIRPEQMPYTVGIPYRDGSTVTYDSGDFPASLEKALEAIGGIEAFRAEQRAAWAQHRYIGLGIGCYLEGTGAGPFEGATVRVDPSGGIIVATGACSQGQGHETVFAQIAADEWGVRPEDVSVVISDTAGISYGYGTIASRSAVVSSAAIRAASAVLRRKVLDIAAHLLECDQGDLELRNGAAAIKGVPQQNVSLRDIARAAQPGPESSRPPGVAGGLEATEYYEPPTVAWAPMMPAR